MTLLDHLATRCTTVCRCWGVTRQDGLKLGFTDHDRDLAFDGFVFSAGSGLTASVLEQSTGMSVDNAEAVGALSAAAVTEEDLRAGRFDSAEVAVWLVNWSEPEQRMLRFRGTIGEVSQAGITFRAELRGLTDALNRPTRRVFQKDCSAVLGDTRCKVDLSDPAYQAEVTILAMRGASSLLVERGAFTERWFAGGSLAFQTGAAKGLSAVIRMDTLHEDGRQIDLWKTPAVMPVIGDRLLIRAGCDRTASTCRNKFGNFLNFRGFPDLPGDDWLASVPMHRGKRDGKSRRWD